MPCLPSVGARGMRRDGGGDARAPLTHLSSTHTCFRKVTLFLLVYAWSLYGPWQPGRVRRHRRVGTPPLLSSFSQDDVHQLFGFRTRDDLRLIMDALEVPARIRTKNRYVYPGESAFLVMLARLRDGRRWSQWESVFRRDSTHLSEINAHMIHWLYTTHASPRLERIAWTRNRMPTYAAAIAAKCRECVAEEHHASVPYDIWAFIDGTVRPTSKPSAAAFPGLNLQAELYSGHKRYHGIKYQALHTPDGLCCHMYGGIGARRHDTTLLRLSGILEELRNLLLVPGRMVYRIMGDPAYPRMLFILTGFKGPNVTPTEARFNTMMSRVRIAVEWGFKHINCRWEFLNKKATQKLLEAPLRKQYMCAAFLSNLITCVGGGNQTSAFFNCAPPTVAQYLALTA